MRRGAALLVLALGVAGCGAPGGPEPGPGAGVPERSMLRLPLEADVRGFDPAQSNDVPTTRVLGAVYEALLQYDYLARPLRVIPDLARQMPEVSADGRVYTFRLRDDVTYHRDPCFGDSLRKLRAEDFVLAFQRVADPRVQSGGWWVLDGWIEGLNAWRDAGADYSREVPGLAAPDPLTFRVHLTRPYPQFLYMMTMVFAAPVPREAVERYGDGLLEHDVGTGPFRLARRVPKSRIVLERNPDYREVRYPSEGPEWAGPKGLLEDAGKRLPLLDEIRYEVMVEAYPAWLSFLAGKLDISPIPKDAFGSAVVGGRTISSDMAARGIRLQVRDSQTLWWIGMNMAHPVFAGERGAHLRKAIAHAHDARRFVDLIFAGRGTPHQVPLPPQLPSFSPEAFHPVYPHDLEKAAGHLAAAGFPQGRGAPKLTLDLRDESTGSRQAGEFLQAELARIGLEVELVANTYNHYLQRAHQGQLMLYLGRWIADYPDEENWTQLLFGPNASPGTNFSSYRNPAYDALHERTRIMTDSPERRTLVQRMVNLALEDCPWRVSFLENRYVLHHRWVKNFVDSDEIYNFHKYLRVDAGPPD